MLKCSRAESKHRKLFLPITIIGTGIPIKMEFQDVLVIKSIMIDYKNEKDSYKNLSL